ncbi:WXG100 family type VII secretion target [Nocardia rhamnosiphila]
MSFDDAAPPDNDLIEDESHYSNAYFQEDVSWLSNIGLEGDQETGGLGVLKGTVAGDAWDIYGNLRNDNSGEAVFGVAGVAATAAEAVKDPFGFAGTQVAKWMLEHIEPLRQAYEELTGNPAMVEAYSKSWQAISTELSTTRTQWQRTLETDINTWSGSAGDAYRNHAEEVLTAIDTAAAAAAALGELMDKTSKIIAIVRDLVRDIIAALLGAAIGYTIELAVTAGAAAGHVIASFLAKLAKSSLDTMTYLKKLNDVIWSFGTYSEPLAKALQNAWSWRYSGDAPTGQPTAAT